LKVEDDPTQTDGAPRRVVVNRIAAAAGDVLRGVQRSGGGRGAACSARAARGGKAHLFFFRA
jgi:hypothetical protein